MALDDDAVIVAAQGFVYVNDIGAAPPTPSQVDSLDPETFGAEKHHLTITGTPTAVTLTVASDATVSIPLSGATADSVTAAFEALDAVGPGNVKVTGTTFVSSGFDIYFVEALLGKQLGAITATFTAGTSPALVEVITAPNGWDNIGHTSRNEMPEWGFEGGKMKMKGTWQKKRLREVEDGDPIEDSVMVNLEQWDPATMELYFGSNVADTPGIFGIDGNFDPVEKSFLIILVDGESRIGFYASKASIQRDKAIKLPIDDFATMPIKATFLNLGNRRLYDWISLAHFGS